MSTFLLLLLLVPRALAWGQHYLVTDRALENPWAAWTAEAVPAEPIEAFLADQPEALDALFRTFAEDMRAAGSQRVAYLPFDTAHPDLAAFLRSARLNPHTRFPLVERLLPGAPAGAPLVPPEEVSPYLHEDPTLEVRFVAVEPGGEVTVRSVLSTFSDEPDWGMDHELWGYEEYGYGEQPYGKPHGESSKAPFHMQFAHEPWIVRKAASHVTTGAVVDRIELFLRLARLAHATGHPYWGHRFTAWAVHYVEDLAQPYHSRALPSAGTGFYLRYIVSPHKDRLQSEATQLAANRHFVYEDFVAWGLQRSYVEDDPVSAALAGYLAADPPTWADLADPRALAERVMELAAARAPQLDRTLVRVLGPRLAEDPTYDVETAQDYAIADVIAAMPPDDLQGLLASTGEDFRTAGVAARTLIDLARRR